MRAEVQLGILVPLPKPREHTGILLLETERGWSCGSFFCWCADEDMGNLVLVDRSGNSTPIDLPEEAWP